MDVDLGLTDELRNQKAMLGSIHFMNVSIGSNEYWVIGTLKEAKEQEETWVYVNPYDNQVLVYFYDVDKLDSFMRNYRRKDMEPGEYKPNSDVLSAKDFKVNKLIGIACYRQEYSNTAKQV